MEHKEAALRLNSAEVRIDFASEGRIKSKPSGRGMTVGVLQKQDSQHVNARQP